MNVDNLPDGWKFELLESLGFTYSGLSGKTKNDFGSGKPYIPYMNVFSSFKIEKENLEYVQIKNNENQNQVKCGDILFTTSSETPHEVGLSSVLLDEIPEVYLNSFCFGFRLHNFNLLTPEYACYLFRSEEVRKVISVLAQGSTRFNLSKNTLLRKLYLKLPTLPEQQKIAEILSTVDEKLEVIAEQIEHTQELKKGLMQRLLTKGLGHTQFKDSPLGQIPESWEIIKIGEVLDLVNGKAFKPSDWDTDGLPIIRIQNLNSKNADFNYFNGAIEERYLVHNGDLLFAWSGTKGVSFGARIWKGSKAVLNQHIFRVVADGVTILPEFTYFLLKKIQNEIENKAHGFKSSFVHVKKSDITEISFPLPTLNEQHQIADILTTIDEKLDVLEDKKEQYQELKKGLMQQLLTGKLRVNHLIEQSELV